MNDLFCKCVYHLLQVSLFNQISIDKNGMRQRRAGYRKRMSSHGSFVVIGIGGYVDEQLESNTRLGGTGCLIKKEEKVENCANWLLRKSGRVC